MNLFGQHGATIEKKITRKDKKYTTQVPAQVITLQMEKL